MAALSMATSPISGKSSHEACLSLLAKKGWQFGNHKFWLLQIMALLTQKINEDPSDDSAGFTGS